MTHVYVALDRDADGYPPYETEEIDAVEVSGGQYVLNAVPVFAHGLSLGDVVRVVRVVGDPRLWVAEVVEESGNWTARIVLTAPLDLHEVAAEFVELGCVAHLTPFGLVAVGVPGQLDQSSVMDALTRGRVDGKWDFDLGVAPA